MSQAGNNGIISYGGNVTANGAAFGEGTSINNYAAQAASAAGRQEAGGGCHVGVVTILATETQAVREVLRLRPDSVTASRGHFYSAPVVVGEESINVVATRTLAPGQRSVMAALSSLTSTYSPAVLALVGIAGGIHRKVKVGDVVVATRVVYYDLRKETAEGTQRRGEEREAPRVIGHAINSFFTDHGDPAVIRRRRNAPISVSSGPVGSGEAVIADGGSGLRRYLSAYNDKILAVDMEAGGLSQFCHEAPTDKGVPPWVVVRGISDHADSGKNDDYQESAAFNAAVALRELLPYLQRAGRQ